MSRTKFPRTITLTNETFNGLKAMATFNQFSGSPLSSPSKILEYLAADYLTQNESKIQMLQRHDEQLQDLIRKEQE